MGYWLDEAYTVSFAALPFPKLVLALRHIDAVFALYYAFLHVWLIVFHVPLSLRLFSMFCGLVTVGLVFAIGLQLYNRPTALLASLLCAVSFPLLEAAREARMYALLTAAVTASWLLIFRLFDRPTIRSAVAYAVATALALYVHPFAILTVVAQATSALLWRREDTFRLVIGAVVCAVLIFVPLMFAAHGQVGQISWIARPRLNTLWPDLYVASGGKLPAAVGVLLVALAATRIVRRHDGRDAALLAWLLVPSSLALAFSEVQTPVFQWRYLVEVAPAAALLIAGVVTTFPWGVRVAALAVLIVASVNDVRDLYRYVPEDWGAIGGILKRQAVAHQALVLYPSALELSYRLALPRQLSAAPKLELLYPHSSTPLRLNPGDSIQSAVDVPRRTFWLIAQTLFKQQLDAGVAAERGRVVESHEFGDLILQRVVQVDYYRAPR